MKLSSYVKRSGRTLSRNKSHSNQSSQLTAAGGVIGALLASTCCIVPLVLITLGASGAWIGKLTALKDYQPYFVVLTLSFLAAGFWQVYWRSEKPCDDDAICATPKSEVIVKSALWVATILVALSLTVDLWAPLFY